MPGGIWAHLFNQNLSNRVLLDSHRQTFTGLPSAAGDQVEIADAGFAAVGEFGAKCCAERIKIGVEGHAIYNSKR